MPIFSGKWQVGSGKWIIGIVLLILALTISLFITYNLSLTTSHAETTLERAQSDYTFQYSKYRDALERYLVAKSQFETFKTAVAKGEAFTKTKEYLVQIDSVYVAYILLVKEQGNYIDWGREEPQKAEIFKLLDEEVTYFQDHPKQIEATQTLEELPVIAKNTREHVDKILSGKIYKTFATFEVAETVSTYDKFVELADKIDVLVQERLQKEPNPFLANWSSEIKDIKEKALKPLEEARSELSVLPARDASESGIERITATAKRSKEEIKKSKALFEEAVRIL